MEGELEEKLTNDDIQLVNSVKYKEYIFIWVMFHPHSDFIYSCNYEKDFKIWSYSGNELVIVNSF